MKLVFTSFWAATCLIVTGCSRGENVVPGHANAMHATKPSDTEIVLARTLDSPRETVFAALTQAEHIRNWMKPSVFVLDSARWTCGRADRFGMSSNGKAARRSR